MTRKATIHEVSVTVHGESPQDVEMVPHEGRWYRLGLVLPPGEHRVALDLGKLTASLVAADA